VKDDYRTVTTALRDALNRFATGVYVLWYPLLERHDVTALRRRLDALPGKRLHVELEVVPRTAPGMYGSGLLVLNPPWQLQAQLEACQGALEETLCGVGAKGLSIAAGQGVA
jgi:23S rRNA (adenine2030-N6)-methyltransferase